MLLRKLVVVGLAGFFSLAANIATAEDAAGPTATLVGVDDANFADPSEAFPDRFEINVGPGDGRRFASLGPGDTRGRADRRDSNYELSVVANATSGLEVAFAQRGGLGFNAQGDIDRHSRSSELRLGRGLRNMPRDAPSATPKWYVFAASEDEALIWRPGSSSAEFGGAQQGFALQDRVEIGDIQAGVTYEHYGWQTSFAYVRREVSVQAGHQTFSEDSDFVGLTLTMRH